MKLMKWAIVIVIFALIASVGNSLWQSMNFDSKVSGYVQNAVRAEPDAITQRIMEIASECNISLEYEDIIILPLNEGWEVTCTYDIDIGIGGFSYTWNKEVVARTRFGGTA